MIVSVFVAEQIELQKSITICIQIIDNNNIFNFDYFPGSSLRYPGVCGVLRGVEERWLRHPTVFVLIRRFRDHDFDQRHRGSDARVSTYTKFLYMYNLGGKFSLLEYVCTYAQEVCYLEGFLIGDSSQQ